MNIQETKLTAEVGSSGELNRYLSEGWILLLAYVRHSCDTHSPRFVVGWQSDDAPVFPDMLDEWERREIERQSLR